VQIDSSATFISTLSLKGSAEVVSFLDDKALGTFDCGLRERAIQNIFAILGLGVREEAERGAILVEGFVETRFFVPAILIVVDVVVGLWVGEVKLERSGQRCDD
jgi:hypothetical protein